MYVLMICLIAVVLIIGIFCVVVVTRDIVTEERAKKNASEAATATPVVVYQPAPAPQQTEEPEVEEPKEEPAKEEPATEEPATEETAVTEDVAEEAEDDGVVNFATGTKTLDEKYLELTPEFKGYYDEIVRFANTVEGSKRYKNANYEEYKVGKNRLVRLKIKRETVICELVIPNLAFKNYVSENKVEVKQAPATIKVVDDATLSAVKDSMQIAINAIEEERAYKKEQAKLRRRQKRAAESTEEK